MLISQCFANMGPSKTFYVNIMATGKKEDP